MSVLSRILRPAATVALGLAVGLLLHAPPARSQGYPHLGLYAMVYDDGEPLWKGGVADPAAFAQFARFNELVIEPTPFTPYHPEGIAELRRLRPDIRLLAYVTGHYIWYSAAADSNVHFPTRYWRTVRDLDGFLYDTHGAVYGTMFADVNLAKRDAGGHFVVAEALASLFYDAVLRSGMWDGIFLDTFCDPILWVEAAGESIDVVRAGYPDRAAFAAGWHAGADTLAGRLRALAGPNAIMVGNCGRGTKYAVFNGWMRENFPYQNGGTWFSNMYDDPGGYFLDDARFRRPTHDYIFTAASGTNTPYTSDNLRRVRFGLGSASLGEGFHVFGPSDRLTRGVPFHGWWYDEYAVDLTTGRSSGDPAHTGWLGAPLGPAYQMIWLSAGPDAVSNPGFETDVASGWTFNTAVGSTLTRDTGTSAVGVASAHVSVPVASSTASWSTALTTIGTLTMSIGQQYSATFWARAATPRAIRLAAGRTSGGGEYAARSVDITTTWTRYQVVLVPAAAGQATLQFHLAGETGDVWLDDVHFQVGVNGIYRRDFQNGIVLVNPGSTTQSVVLERPFRRILGSLDLLANDGVEAGTVNVPPMDARFLIGTDAIPPAAVQDLRLVPPVPGAPRRAP